MVIFEEKCIYMMKKALIWAALLLSVTVQAQDRMDWFRDAKFGMFIHWGIYTELAGIYGDKTDGGEWMMHSKQIPISEYSALAGQFNPVRFDADDWMSLAAEAGQRYLVVTAKHHDGFAMYGSKVSSYNIVDATPYGRDVLQELHDACLRHGIHFGFYYSHMLDWYHPGANGCAWDPAHKGSRQDYLDKVAVPQVRELLDRFPDAEIVWFDQGGDITEEEAMRFYGMVRENPSIIMNNRIGGGLTGDVITPEQFIPATGYNGKPWETCMTMNRHWAYCAYDDNWKSAGEIILKLSEIVSKGGNLLLNIGPDKYGTIPQVCRDNLKAIGRWMKVNGEAIQIGKAYTSSDDKIETRANLYNEWVAALPEDARRADGNLDGAAPIIVDKEAFADVKTVEVTFDFVPGKAPAAAAAADAAAPLTEDEITAIKAGKYNAYTGIQTEKYTVRNEWSEANYGRDSEANPGYFNRLTGWDADNNAVDFGGTFEDALIDHNGEYTVTMTTGDMGFAEGDSKIRMLFVSTEIPSRAIDEGIIAISDVKVKFGDGRTQAYTEITTSGTYARITLLDEYNQTEEPVSYNMPIGANTSITITFTVSGMAE